MKKGKTLIYALLASAAAAAVACVSALIMVSVQNLATGDLQAQLAELQKSKQDLETRESVLLDWESVDKEYETFRNTYLIPFNDFSVFRREYENMLDRNSLQTTRLNYRIKSMMKDTVRVAFEFGVVGRYQDLKRFMFDVERHPRMLFLTGAQLDRGESGASARFTMEVFFAR